MQPSSGQYYGSPRAPLSDGVSEKTACGGTFCERCLPYDLRDYLHFTDGGAGSDADEYECACYPCYCTVSDKVTFWKEQSELYKREIENVEKKLLELKERHKNSTQELKTWEKLT